MLRSISYLKSNRHSWNLVLATGQDMPFYAQIEGTSNIKTKRAPEEDDR